MDHHEQHQKEREKRIAHEKAHERALEKQPAKIHPAWFMLLGFVLVALVIAIWIFI